MKKNLLFILMLVLSLMAFSACSDDSTDEPVTGTCDPACGEGETCQDGTCVPVGTDPCEGVTCDEGFYCDQNTGECVEGEDPCADVECEEGFTCDQNTGECVEEGTDPDVCDPACGTDEKCVDGECVPTGDCDPECGECELCEDGECVADPSCEVGSCTSNDECAEGFCCLNRDACGEDYGQCITLDAPCEVDTDCEANELCDENGMCVPIICGANADCPAGFVCSGGVCIVAPDCGAVDSVQIDQGAGRIAEGQTLQLSATLFNANGGVVMAEGCVTWASDNEAAVAVADGLLTGGTETGMANITATVTGGSASDSVAYQNFAAVAEGTTRVVVFEDGTGNAVVGANVAINDGARGFVEGTTDDGGVAEIEVDCTGGCDFHVFHNDYTYVSAYGLMANDVLLPVTANLDESNATGVKGYQDASPIPASVSEGMDVRLGLSAFSIPGTIADLNFEALLGEMMPTQVLDWEVDLPGGLELYLSGESVKEGDWTGYYAAGVPGKGTLWGLGGYASLTELIELVTSNMSGDIDVGAILGAILPLFESFYHANMPGFDLDSIPKVQDVDDINGNGETDDMVPDFANWPKAGSDGKGLKLTQWQSQMSTLSVGRLPDMDGVEGTTCADAVITLVGAMQTGIGFVPLGLNAAMDKLNNDDSPDCQVGAANDGNVDIVYAPQHDGVTGYDYVVLSLALSVGGLLGDISLKEEEGTALELSGVVSFSEGAPATVAQPDFIGFMQSAAYDSATGQLTNGTVDGANMYRALLAKDYAPYKKYWHVYYGDGATGFTLPTTDDFSFDIEDRGTGEISSMSMVQAFKLAGTDFNGLLGFNDKNINQLNWLMEAFSIRGLSAL